MRTVVWQFSGYPSISGHIRSNPARRLRVAGRDTPPLHGQRTRRAAAGWTRARSSLARACGAGARQTVEPSAAPYRAPRGACTGVIASAADEQVAASAAVEDVAVLVAAEPVVATATSDPTRSRARCRARLAPRRDRPWRCRPPHRACGVQYDSVSRPGPPSSVSASGPRPGAAPSRSPSVNVSAPSPPVRTSVPPPPSRTSSVGLPVSTSSPGPPKALMPPKTFGPVPGRHGAVVHVTQQRPHRRNGKAGWIQRWIRRGADRRMRSKANCTIRSR